MNKYCITPWNNQRQQKKNPVPYFEKVLNLVHPNGPLQDTFLLVFICTIRILRVIGTSRRTPCKPKVFTYCTVNHSTIKPWNFEYPDYWCFPASRTWVRYSCKKFFFFFSFFFLSAPPYICTLPLFSVTPSLDFPTSSFSLAMFMLKHNVHSMAQSKNVDYKQNLV